MMRGSQTGDVASSKAQGIIDNFFRDPLNSSHVLDISACNISALPNGLEVLISENPAAAARLTQLNLAHNSLTTLPQCLALLPNLRILFLLKNRFTSVPDVLRKLTALRMLSFKENTIEGVLDASTLPPDLTWLILTSNRITALSPEFPTRCRHVRKLMLSNNCLSALPEGFGEEMRSLELLRLSNNAFEEFPSCLFMCPNLVWLSLAGNPCAGGPITSSQLPTAQSIDLAKEYAVDWGNPFGSGTSGTAFPGVHREDGSLVAVKKFKNLHGSDGRALDEVDISLAAAGVDGLVKARGYYCGIDDAGVEQVALVTELVPGNARTIAGPPSFETCTRSAYPDGFTLSEAKAMYIVDQVERAVEGLLAKRISHGDVYGHNVLIGEHNGDLVVKLGDLGAAWRFDERNREGIAKLERRALHIFRKEVFELVAGSKRPLKGNCGLFVRTPLFYGL